jgi:hypothetical protein
MDRTTSWQTAFALQVQFSHILLVRILMGGEGGDTTCKQLRQGFADR